MALLMEPNTELARFPVPRLGSCGRGRAAGTGTAVSVTLFSSIVCFSLWPDTSDRVDRNDAVRRFRSRFDGCDSSFFGVMLVNALRELPKMLRRLSLDMVSGCVLWWRAPPLARSASVINGACGEAQAAGKQTGARCWATNWRTLAHEGQRQGGAVANIDVGGQSRRM